MRRLMVTGGSGLLGASVCRAASTEAEVIGLYWRHEPREAGFRPVRLDLTDFRGLKAAMAELKPDGVIHTAAISHTALCEKDRAATRKINVQATVNLAGLCADRGIPFVFTSSDLVFDGRNAPYCEEDPVNPINAYAEQKVEAETGILERHPAAAVCRMPVMFGLADGEPKGALRGLLLRKGEGEPVKLFTDEIRTPAGAPEAAAGLLIALEKAKGLLHLGGNERISRYRFAHLAAEVFETDTSLFVPCLQSDLALKPARPPDVSLDSTKARALGYNPPSLKSQLEHLREEWNNRRERK
jgi:dTDP-4-dehydrorhamnose reductase